MPSQPPDRSAPLVSEVPTPGCACSRCLRLKELQERGAPDALSQMGRVQQHADLLGWSDAGSSYKGDNLRSAERADRELREAHGRPLPAAYRYLLGPTPRTTFNDRDAALIFWKRIEDAIEQGGWTRSEWRRLNRIRDKWKARATGSDPRYVEVGNRGGSLDKHTTANVQLRKIVQAMQRVLDNKGD